MIRILLCFLLVTVSIFSVKAQCPAASSLVVNSITATQSSCQASGTITVLASGGATPYTYTIIAGPSTAPAQSSNVFSSLVPGAYSVKVTDNCNTSDTVSVTVTGSYTIPSPAATTQSPTCPGGSDGSLTVAVTGGVGPFSYSLISPSPVTAGPQTSNVFTNLAPGSYTYRVSDSCGNFQTRTVTLAAASAESMSVFGILSAISCDSFSLEILTGVPGSRPPYTVSVTLPDGRVLSQVFTGAPGTVTFNFHFHHIYGNNELVSYSITDNCGSQQGSSLNLKTYLDIGVSSVPPVGCGGQYSYLFGTPILCGTPTYTLISPSGTVLATQTSNWFSGFPPGNGYKLVRQECCSSDTVSFNWAAPPGFHFSGVQVASYSTCREGTAAIILTTNIADLSYIIIASGAPSMTLADGTVHTFSYPDTLTTDMSNAGYLDEFPVGTYKFYAVSTCGEKDSITVTVQASDLRHDTFLATMKAGCSGNNEITMQVTSTAGEWGVNSASIYVNSAHYADINSYSYSSTDGGLPGGTYYLSYNYSNLFGSNGTYLPGLDGSCDVLRDTINIPAYTQPSFSTLPAIANCGTTRNVALLPDSASGVQPYTFQMISPTASAVQSTPVFDGLTAGTYTFEMSDACGNSYSSNVSVNTLAPPVVTVTGGTCAGGAATFSLPASPFYSYTWQHPDGSTSTGNSLLINPVTATDTGAYQISLTSVIGGCTSTSSTSVSLEFCTVLAESLLTFTGQYNGGVVQLNWQSAIETNLAYYVVERSTDGINFTPLWEVTAKNGTMNSYATTDAHPPSGVVYYRLQMVEAGGTVHYSQVISVSSAVLYTVYPRLFTGAGPVTVTYPKADGNGLVKVVSVDGRIWLARNIAAGTTATSLELGALPMGVYFVVFNGNATEVIKE
ncbi:SprB repeat-containing protein [Dinghuibacter silviterrae]|uniref:SprB-like repeat protein n=1 Tax=Dinghuibacter silviterrae TaxID=1539049 RepID=A0A4R8DFL7_9BACT|nr:SprB repeat-containing protein [Dinghuibacter silviterrae]TDW96381.1 SprB-like repeat protein [Dinghuibacter silviterrae]